MQTSRQKRLRELTEREYVRRELPVFLEKVSAALGREISESDLLSDDVSQTLRTRVESELIAGFRRPFPENHLTFAEDDGERFQAEFHSQALAFGAEKVALLLGTFNRYPLLLVDALEVSLGVFLPYGRPAIP